MEDFFQSQPLSPTWPQALRTKTYLGFKNSRPLFFASIKKSNLNQIGIVVSWLRMRPELLWVGVMRNMRKDFSFLLFKKTNSSSYASMPQSSSGHTQVDYCWIKEVYRALIGWMLQCEPEEQVSGNSKLVTHLIEYFSVVFRSFCCLKNFMKLLIMVINNTFSRPHVRQL